MTLPLATGQSALDVLATPTTPLVDASLGLTPLVLTQAACTNPAPLDRAEQEKADQALIAQAKADGAAAISRATGRLQDAMIKRAVGAPMPQDVNNAITRFFSGSPLASLDTLFATIKPVADNIVGFEVRPIRDPSNTGESRPNIQNLHIGVLQMKQMAFSVASPDFPPPNYIAVYPPWFATPDLQAGQLVHESFHMSYPTFRDHPKNNPNPLINAFAFGGFVSVLGGLAVGPLVNAYFPP